MSKNLVNGDNIRKNEEVSEEEEIAKSLSFAIMHDEYDSGKYLRKQENDEENSRTKSNHFYNDSSIPHQVDIVAPPRLSKLGSKVFEEMTSIKYRLKRHYFSHNDT